MILRKGIFKLKLPPDLIFGLILCTGCTDIGKSKVENIPEDQAEINLFIKSPYSCFNEVKINKKGAGVSIVGYPKGNQVDTIVGKKEFKINSERDMLILTRTIEAIVTNPSNNPTKMDDGYRFIVKIDNRKVLDRYGQDSLLNNILTLLLPYVEKDDNGQCDFFNLYKKGFQ